MSKSVFTALLNGFDPTVANELDNALRKLGGVLVGTEGSHDVDVLVVGPIAVSPLQNARDLRELNATSNVMFVLDGPHAERFAASLRFVPFLSAATVTPADLPPEALATKIQQVAEDAVRRKKLGGLRAAVNQQLSPGLRPRERHHPERSVVEEYLGSLIAQAPEALVAIDNFDVVLAWNRRAEELLLQTEQEALNRRYQEFLPPDISTALERVISLARAGGKALRQRYEWIQPSGLTAFEMSSGPIRSAAGAITGVSLTISDVTESFKAQEELRYSEHRFRTLIDSLPQLVWTTQPDGNCDFFSPQWLRYTGVPAEEQLGFAWLDRVVHPDDRARAAERWNDAYRNGGNYDVEYRIRGVDGTYRWFKTRGVRLTDERGQTLHWFGTSTDIQDIVEARETLARDAAVLETEIAEQVQQRMVVEEQLRQSQKMEAVGQLTGGLAHDFNNILAGIGGSLEMMNTRLTQGRIEELDRYVTAARGAVRRAANLTQRLLAFSRRQTLDPEPTELNGLVNGMLELINRSVGPEIEVETVGASGLWTIFIDQAQLENALLNLCINARDAMPDGGKLTIETANRWMDGRSAGDRGLDPGQYVSLCVSDTGSGMSDDVIAKAFDPFFTTKPIGQGTGLGLSMVYGFAGQSGGTVRIYSELGRGTMVCIYLPRHLGAAGVEHKPTEFLDMPRSRDADTILLVDDEPLIRMVAAEQLEELGYSVIEAGDGSEALKILRSGEPIDLLVTDVGLPGGLNGRQLAEAARQDRPDLGVLFITGYAENAVLNHGHLEHGMHVLTKPFQMDALAQRVSDLLQRRDQS